MKAMLLRQHADLNTVAEPLELIELTEPEPGPGEVLVRVETCGVCHTELDEIEARLPPSRLPIILGHQVVGRVDATGLGALRFRPGDRVGIAWIHSACGRCRYCLSGQENLCPSFAATGCDAPGGYAEYTTVAEAFAYPIPDLFTSAQAAPLLCAGAIGFRSLRLAGLRDDGALGLTGFGASAHLVLQMVRLVHPAARVYVFARSEREREFARALGATWAGDTEADPPEELDCIIDTTPAWKPIIEALRRLRPGGRLVVNAIRKEEGDKSSLLSLDYPAHLWLEKEIKSVANVTRKDVTGFLDLAASQGHRAFGMAIVPEVEEYPLEDANVALMDLKARRIRGAKVLRIS